VLASDVPLMDAPVYADGAAAALMSALRKRYNFVVADVPFNGMAFSRDLIRQANQRVLVLLPSLVSIRDTLKLLGLKAGTEQTDRPVLVLNRLGMPGGLQRRQVEETLAMKIDVAIPDLPRVVANAVNLGEPAAAARSPLRTAIMEITTLCAASGLLDQGKRSSDGAEAPVKRGWRLFGGRK
jgi:pilus assembly protein CpaE